MKNNNYLKIIKQIEKIRLENYVNCMDILILAFKQNLKNAVKL